MKPLIIYGTRPELIKLAPVIRECHGRDGITPIVLTTCQHKQICQPLLQHFGVRNNFSKDFSDESSLHGFVGKATEWLGHMILALEPDCVVVQGDTSTVLAASLAAFLTQTPLVHVEAGLRTGTIGSPFPEEFIRRAATLGTTKHCAPTWLASHALRKEGVPEAEIRITGNTAIDSLLWTLATNPEPPTGMDSLSRDPFVLITCHRRENHGQGLHNICQAVQRLAERHKDVQFVWPVHGNPAVARGITKGITTLPENLTLLGPQSYPQFCWLLARAHVTISDSGGIQEELPSVGGTILITRESTERPEVLGTRLARLVGTDTDLIVGQTTLALSRSRRQPVENPFGDGTAAEKIVDFLLA